MTQNLKLVISLATDSILSHSSLHPLRKSQSIVPGGGDAVAIHHGTDTTVRGGIAMLSAAGQGMKGGIKRTSVRENCIKPSSPHTHFTVLCLPKLMWVYLILLGNKKMPPKITASHKHA